VFVLLKMELRRRLRPLGREKASSSMEITTVVAP
jgi:hypothetical protein